MLHFVQHDTSGTGATTKYKSKSRNKVNYPTSANNGQIWGTRADNRSRSKVNDPTQRKER
jgi:hypothetical protein